MIENADETFRSISHRLSATPFTTVLTDSEAKAADITRRCERGIRVYKPKGNRWMVNYYIGGCLRTWARPPSAEAACRLSDMLTFRFAAQRVRIRSPLGPDDFNISAERAALDLKNEPGILSLLVQMEACLPDKVAPRGRPKGTRNHTLRDEVLKIFDTIMFRLNDVLARHDTHDKQLKELRAVLRSIEDRGAASVGAGLRGPMRLIRSDYGTVVNPNNVPFMVPPATPEPLRWVSPTTGDPPPAVPSIFCVNGDAPAPGINMGGVA
jgi:hypothetical protein